MGFAQPQPMGYVQPQPMGYVQPQPVGYVQPQAQVIVQPQPAMGVGMAAAGMAVGMATGGVLQRYHLHATARVTAEHHVIAPGSPAGKPQNLLSPGMEPWNKWEAPHHNRSWVEIEFAEKLMFRGIGFKSAGDHPRMAPTEVRIFAWNMLAGGWHEIGFRQLNFGMNNWHVITFPEIHGDTKKVQFHFHNGHGKEGVQLGEIIFHHF